MNHAPNLLVAPNHGVELALPRQQSEVAPVFFERLILLFGVLVSDALSTANVLQGAQDSVARDALHAQGASRLACSVRRQPQQQVFRADILVLEAHRLVEGGVQGGLQSLGDLCADRRRARHLRASLQVLRYRALDGARHHAQLLQQRRHNASLLLHQRQQQVFAVNRRVAVLFREALRLLQGFLRLNRQFVKSHRRPSKLSMVLSSRLTSTL
jgi:hypothetical protein